MFTTSTRGKSATAKSAAALAAAALVLGACSANQESSAGQPTAPAGSTVTASDDDNVTMKDGWVRANTPDMTAVFGALHNPTDTALQLVSVDTDVAARAELHETVESAGSSMMREAAGGLTIPAGGDLVLAPGGYHIMLMDLAKPVIVGQRVALTLHFDDGSVARVTASGRAFEGANEEYSAEDHGTMGSGSDGMAGMTGAAGSAGMTAPQTPVATAGAN